MSGHTATTTAYVRTSAGVAKVAAGERVPDDTLPGELQRLVDAGVLEAEAAPRLDPPPPAVGKPGARAPRARANADEAKA